jgi:N-acetylmuramoyl-L-alanine amidase
MQYKKTSKLLIILSSFLIAINILMPVARVYAQTVLVEEVSSQFNEEVNCLAQNIYFEAAKESFEGKLAVAQVTINRVNSGKFADTVCGVVKQKDKINGVMICQFSWFCNKAYAIVRNQYQWDESIIVAKKALTEPVAHDMLYKNNAMYYHANYVNPGWHLTKVAQIGNHIFYRQ